MRSHLQQDCHWKLRVNSFSFNNHANEIGSIHYNWVESRGSERPVVHTQQRLILVQPVDHSYILQVNPKRQGRNFIFTSLF